MINCLVFHHNLVQHRRQTQMILFQVILGIIFLVYFLLYLTISITAKNPEDFIRSAYPVFCLFDGGFVTIALALYTYSICLVRKAVNESSQYYFANKITYVVISLYVALVVLQGAYFLTWKLYDGGIIVLTMQRIIAYLLIDMSIYYMVCKSAQGMTVKSSRLMNGNF